MWDPDNDFDEETDRKQFEYEQAEESKPMNTETAIAKAVDYLAQISHKTEKEIIMILLVEALTARGIMKPMESR